MGGIDLSPDALGGVGIEARIQPVIRHRRTALKKLFIDGRNGPRVIEYHHGNIALEPKEAFKVPEESPRLNLPRLQLPDGESIRFSRDVDFENQVKI